MRSIAHRIGLRFRLKSYGLIGSPDLVIPRLKLAIFVHGCFWHQHRGCAKATMPQSNRRFWEEKLRANVLRDRRSRRKLVSSGWRVIVIWECQTRDAAKLSSRLRAAS